MTNVMMKGTKADCLRVLDGLVHRLVRQGESTHGYSIRPSAANWRHWAVLKYRRAF